MIRVYVYPNNNNDNLLLPSAYNTNALKRSIKKWKEKEKGHKKKHAQFLITSDTLKPFFFIKNKIPPISYQRVLLMKLRNSNEMLREARVLELPVPSSLRPIGRPVPIRLFKLTPTPFCTLHKYTWINPLSNVFFMLKYMDWKIKSCHSWRR